MKFTLAQFSEFSKNIRLDIYRQRYVSVKIVEMDLPEDIQAIKTIFEQYWENKDSLKEPPTFDEYYKVYLKDTEGKRQKFRDKSGFDNNCSCFDRGLEARIYRTWVSVITQIHAGYVAESVFGKGTVQMSSELDHKGIDFLVTRNNEPFKIQIKKSSHRLESRIERKLEKDIHVINYFVPLANDFGNPYYKVGKNKGKIKQQLLAFIEFDPDNGVLQRYDNGFIVFTPKAFENFL
jgi:hypothetical protein